MGQPKIVQQLLEAGVDANARLGDTCSLDLGVEDLQGELNELGIIYPNDEEASTDVRLYLCMIGESDPGVSFVEEDHYNDEVQQQWYPIQHAAYLPDGTEAHKKVRDLIMNLLLDHHANLLATYSAKSSDGDLVLEDLSPHDDMYRTAPLRERTVLHSMLQDGSYVSPILRHKSFKTIDIESRDEQGRTILHAVCRSRLGADAGVEYSARDDYIGHDSGQTLPLRPKTTRLHGQPSFLEYILLECHADIMATDRDGGNALHNLCRSFDTLDHGHIPAIMVSCELLLLQRPQLASQADDRGMYPIHYALMRYMYFENNSGYWGEDAVQEFAQTVRDPRWQMHLIDGDDNCALHYLARRSFIWSPSIYMRYGDLLQDYLEADLDLNLRNKLGRSPLEMFLGVHCDVGFSLVADANDESAAWAKLTEHGADWGVIDDQGNTLIHLLAGEPKNKMAPGFVRRLLQCGVDHDAKNDEGVTAVVVAERSQNVDVLAILGSNEVKEARS